MNAYFSMCFEGLSERSEFPEKHIAQKNAYEFSAEMCAFE